MTCLLQCPLNTDSVLFIQIFGIKSYECETIFHNKWSLKDKELHTLSHKILFSQYVYKGGKETTTHKDLEVDTAFRPPKGRLNRPVRHWNNKVKYSGLIYISSRLKCYSYCSSQVSLRKVGQLHISGNWETTETMLHHSKNSEADAAISHLIKHPIFQPDQ